jgi:hypothetical protein
MGEGESSRAPTKIQKILRLLQDWNSENKNEQEQSGVGM